MEISYILSALRRYWWVALSGLALGVLGLAVLSSRALNEYESHAVLLVVPAGSTPANTGNNDRYIASQISVIKSDSMAANVAERLGNGEPASLVQRSLTVTQQLLTDVVQLVAVAPTAEQAKALNQAYIDEYFALQTAQLDASVGAEAKRLQDRLDTINSQLSDIDSQIAVLIKPYLDSGSANAIPTAEQVAPGLASQRATLLAEYTRVSDAKSQLDLSNATVVGTQIIQEPSLPTSPTSTASMAKMILVLVGGLMMGLVGAIVAARVSRRIIRPDEAVAILDRPLFGVMPRQGALRSHRDEALRSPSRAVASFIDELCVMAEVHSAPGEGLIVLVAGSQRSSGTTTTAVTMATRMAAGGCTVLLIDADARDSEITSLFPADYGLSNMASAEPVPPRGVSAEVPQSGVPGLVVVGLHNLADRTALRRGNVAQFARKASRLFDVVVFDGGALLGSAAAAHLAEVSDVVVMPFPTHHQSIQQLERVGQRLTAHAREAIVIAVPSAKSDEVPLPPRLIESVLAEAGVRSHG